MSIIPFIFWGASLVTGLIVYVVVAKAIEKTGLKRMGATGHLFTCDPKEDDTK